MWCGLGVWEGCTTCFKIQKLNERGIYTKYLQKMMSGPHFEQLRTRLKGLGLGKVGMKKLKNSHRGGVVLKFRIPVVLHDREHGLKFCHKNEFAQGSHKVRIPVKFTLRFWEGTESMHFWKLTQKQIRTRDVLCENFAQQEVLCENCWVLVFLPSFPLFSP